MKKTFRLLLAVAVVSLLFAAAADLSHAKTVVKLAHVVTTDDVFHAQVLKFKDLVETRTKGEIEIQLFPNKQLGDKETDLISMVQQGVIGSAIITCGPITSFDPLFGILDLPFLFTSAEQAYKVLDGPIGERFLTSLEKLNIKALAFGERGFRNVSNNTRPIEKPEDLNGIKIRVMESPVYIATFKALGANPLPMGWGEVYTALQQGTIDAQENPPSVIWAFKLNEVQKYYSLTGHSYSGNVLMMNKALFDGFSPEVRKAILDSAKESAAYCRQLEHDNVANILKSLTEKGMKINEVDRKPFQEKCASVYEDEFKKHPDWRAIVTEIQAIK